MPAASQLLHPMWSEGGRLCVLGCRSLSPPFLLLRVNRLTRAHFFCKQPKQDTGLADLQQGRIGAGQGPRQYAQPLWHGRREAPQTWRQFHVAEAVADMGHRHTFFGQPADSGAGECDCFALRHPQKQTWLAIKPAGGPKSACRPRATGACSPSGARRGLQVAASKHLTVLIVGRRVGTARIPLRQPSADQELHRVVHHDRQHE